MSLFIKETNQIVNKGWGKEIIFVNNGEYCGKILCFDELKKFSMHFHMKKKESWYVLKGKLELTIIKPIDGSRIKEDLNVGDTITILPGCLHQLYAHEYSEIIEVSTQHFDDDSYRVEKGN